MSERIVRQGSLKECDSLKKHNRQLFSARQANVGSKAISRHRRQSFPRRIFRGPRSLTLRRYSLCQTHRHLTPWNVLISGREKSGEPNDGHCRSDLYVGARATRLGSSRNQQILLCARLHSLAGDAISSVRLSGKAAVDYSTGLFDAGRNDSRFPGLFGTVARDSAATATNPRNR